VNLVDFFGYIAMITSIIGLAPQIYKTYKSKSSKDISMSMLFNYFTCSLAWIGYGTLTGSTFVVYSNVLGLLTSIISIVQKRYYDTI